MELTLSKQPVNISEVFYDAATEQPIECDVLLPDYCPDMQKIQLCEVTLSLLSHSVSGDRYSLDGMANANLYYLDEGGCLRHAEYKIPYSKSIELRAAPQNPVATVTQNVDYFNCRAVSQRRLDMRGAISIRIKVTGQSEEQVVCGAQGMGIQLRCEPAENTVLLPQVTRQTKVYEEVELGHGKPAIGNLLRYTAAAKVTDFKVVSGKLVTKGEAAVRILYQCEEDDKAIELMEYSLPISQVIDLPGVEEDCNCHAWYEVCGLDVASKRNVDSENRLFTIDLSINATAGASRRVSLEAASDSYSTEYECKQTVKQVPFLEMLESVSETYAFREQIELPGKIDGIIDLWGQLAGAPTVRVEADAAVVSGKLNISMFARAEGGAVSHISQQKDFSHRIALKKPCETLVFAPHIIVEAANFSMGGAGQMEVRCNIHMSGEIYNQYRRQALCDLAVDESRKKSRKENLLYLYYTDGQEPVWEIAKRYNSSAETIRRENELEEMGVGERRVLLIPMQ